MSIKPGRLNIPIQRRSDFSLSLEFRDSADVPINFTGWGGYAQAWNKDRTIKYVDFEVNFVNRLLGRLDLLLGYDETELLPCESFWDLLLENPSAVRNYYLEGNIYVSEGYTNPPEA